jgi:hypothetical protein
MQHSPEANVVKCSLHNVNAQEGGVSTCLLAYKLLNERLNLCVTVRIYINK